MEHIRPNIFVPQFSRSTRRPNYDIVREKNFPLMKQVDEYLIFSHESLVSNH